MNHGWPALSERLAYHFADLNARQRTRKLDTSYYRHPDFIDLTTNDYLGIGSDNALQAKCRQSIKELSCGAGASRLLGGNHPIFAQVETEFAKFKGAPAALYFPSGYAANEGISSLFKLGDSNIYSDELNHASIIDGLRLYTTKDRRHIFRHNDLAHLETLLESSSAAINFIYTEALFSMDGDLADLKALSLLCERYRGILIVDEAHSLGCYGKTGAGLVAELGLDQQRLISINTCGKALGVQGAFVCAPTPVIDYLINGARSFIYTTAASPWLMGALQCILHELPQLNQRRDQLFRASTQLRNVLKSNGFNIGATNSYIMPIILGSDRAALDAQAYLKQHHILTGAIRPPTVAEGSARLRLSLTAYLTNEQINHVVTVIEEMKHAALC